jgi:hypothetical protein
MRNRIFACVVLAVLAASFLRASPTDKEALISKYKNKFVVVTDEGLSTGLPCAVSPSLAVVKGLKDIQVKEALGAGRCGSEPVQKGEVLRAVGSERSLTRVWSEVVMLSIFGPATTARTWRRRTRSSPIGSSLSTLPRKLPSLVILKLGYS